MQEAHGASDCPICLGPIPLLEEAFLAQRSLSGGCFHRFHFQCILQWTEAQLAHPVPGMPAGASCCACPMCRRPYEVIIHECMDGRAFR